MKSRTQQINIRLSPEELSELDAICAKPLATGSDPLTRATVVRTAIRLYVDIYRATGEAPRLADAVSAIEQIHGRRPVVYTHHFPPKKRRAG